MQLNTNVLVNSGMKLGAPFYPIDKKKIPTITKLKVNVKDVNKALCCEMPYKPTANTTF